MSDRQQLPAVVTVACIQAGWQTLLCLKNTSASHTAEQINSWEMHRKIFSLQTVNYVGLEVFFLQLCSVILS